VIECFPDIHETLSSTPGTAKKKKKSIYNSIKNNKIPTDTRKDMQELYTETYRPVLKEIKDLINGKSL
jgi:hypothetical protein